MNLQTSFLTPPFGFALFYLRSVAPASDYVDRITGARIARMTTGDIYRGSVPFVAMQLAMLAAVIAFPALTVGTLAPKQAIDADSIRLEVQEEAAPAAPAETQGPPADDPFRIPDPDAEEKSDDPGAAFMRESAPGKDR